MLPVQNNVVEQRQLAHDGFMRSSAGIVPNKGPYIQRAVGKINNTVCASLDAARYSKSETRSLEHVL